MWPFAMYVKQQVLNLAGEDIWNKYSECIIDRCKWICSEDGITPDRFPEDEEILSVIKEMMEVV